MKNDVFVDMTPFSKGKTAVSIVGELYGIMRSHTVTYGSIVIEYTLTKMADKWCYSFDLDENWVISYCVNFITVPFWEGGGRGC